MSTELYDSGIHTKERLKELQSLPFERKVLITQTRIIEWYKHFNGNVSVSFSGGKDSTVLLHIARNLFSDIKAVFVDTGLEYPEIKEFVKTFNNVDIIRPEKSFKQVITEYGYPVISKDVSGKIFYARRGSKWATDMLNDCYNSNPDKYNEYVYNMYNCGKYKYLLDSDFKISNKCCNVMKKKPLHKYLKENNLNPMIATMTSESNQRQLSWIKTGCNAFNSKEPLSKPMSFWLEQDILEYIKRYNLEIAKPYGDIIEDKNGKLSTTKMNRTGCMFCMFGCHLEKSPNRFELMKETHPKLYNYCIEGGELIDGKWQPNSKGLGLGHVLDYINVKY